MKQVSFGLTRAIHVKAEDDRENRKLNESRGPWIVGTPPTVQRYTRSYWQDGYKQTGLPET